MSDAGTKIMAMKILYSVQKKIKQIGTDLRQELIGHPLDFLSEMCYIQSLRFKCLRMQVRSVAFLYFNAMRSSETVPEAAVCCLSSRQNWVRMKSKPFSA